MEHLSDASLDDVAAFFGTYYTPDNAVLTIAGDLDRAEAMQWVERYFSPIPKGGPRPPLRDMSVPPTFGETRREVVTDAVALPRVFVASRTPVFGSDGYYPASLAAAILGLRTGSRLEQSLVRGQRVASQASAFTYDLAKGSDLLVVDATAHGEVSAERLEAAVIAELDRIHQDGVTEAEVARACALIETSFVVSLQSAAERADQLSRFATYFNDAGLANEQVARYQAVTAADVSRLARERLGPDNRAILLYVPAPVDESALGVSSDDVVVTA
jgi:predicted Zn-dependent peptidase